MTRFDRIVAICAIATPILCTLGAWSFHSALENTRLAIRAEASADREVIRDRLQVLEVEVGKLQVARDNELELMRDVKTRLAELVTLEMQRGRR